MFGIDMKNLAHVVREGNSCREKKKKKRARASCPKAAN